MCNIPRFFLRLYLIRLVCYDYSLSKQNDKVTINAGDIDILVKSVNPTRLKNNPLALTEDMIRSLYMDIIKKISIIFSKFRG